ncbi:hypothetical protein L1987_80844 [Smallanthus sonchifolius]|uniref:Uncharacterized protein n=1 Tax=Smallanthus sonchifolius TaxID=185202 RepID=A0ACB8YPW2_9ASTR|nr:hypothetical protein L1987_80844 [Smallanthus sonchifolius]
MGMTNIIQTNRRRTSRVSRRVAKKYNKNKLDDHIKSPSSSTSNESALQAVNTDRVSCGIKLIPEGERGNGELGPDEELMNINKFLVSEVTDSDALFGLHGFCSYGDDMEFGSEEVGDDMNVWLWGDDDLELNQFQHPHYNIGEILRSDQYRSPI